MMFTYSEFEFILSLLVFFSIIFPISLFFICYGFLSCLIFVVCQVFIESWKVILENLMDFCMLVGVLEEIIERKNTGNCYLGIESTLLYF